MELFSIVLFLSFFINDSSESCSLIKLEKDCNCAELSLQTHIECIKEDNQVEFDLSSVFTLTSGYSNVSKNFMIQINNKKIPRVGGFLFPNMSLSILDLSSNEIEDLSDQIFNSINDLKQLNMSKNKLKSLNSIILSFSNSKQLHGKLNILDASFNQIEQIDLKFGKEFGALYTLNLYSNRIKFIVDEAFYNLLSLFNLHLGDNSLSSLQNVHFVGLDNVEMFKFINNNIELYIEIRNLGKITKLELINSKLKRFNLANLTNLWLLNFDFNQIEEIKVNQLADLKKLSTLTLRHNQIRSIEDFAFASIPSLAFLDISNNQLEELRPNMFFNLSNLLTLNLGLNRIKTIQSFTFKYLTKLNSLNLIQNQISQIENDAMCYLDNLLEVSLSNNDIRVYQKDMFRCIKNLSTLTLMNHFVTSDAFEHLKKITVIGFYRNELSTITNRTFNQMKQLEKLSIVSCKINQLDSYFLYNLPNLVTISISQNVIYETGEYLFLNLAKLTHLEFSDNNLKILRKNLFLNLTKLEIVNLKNNKIIKIESDAFAGTPMIKHLDLSFNYLKEIKETYFDGNLSSLTFLNLSNNQIRFVKTYSFVKMKNLEILDLSHNYLYQLPKLLFEKLVKLTHINLKANNLKFIEKLHFINLNYLKMLNLEMNAIEKIEENSIALNNLIKLNLANNRLESFKSSIIQPISNLIPDKILDLSYNRFTSISKLNHTQFGNLELLDLSHNSIEVLRRNDFDHYARLLILNISHNHLRIFELSNSFISRIHKLIVVNVSISLNLSILEKIFANELNLGSNKILNLNQNFSSLMPNLKNLQLEACESMKYKFNLSMDHFVHLEVFNANFLKTYPHFNINIKQFNNSKLRSLSLAGINISNIYELRLDLLNDLVDLNLSYNNINYINKDFFPFKNKLKILDFSHNKLKSINKRCFENLKSLEFLDLRFNEIEELTIDLISLHSILLASNFLKKFSCDDYFYKNNLIYSIDLSSNYLSDFKVIFKAQYKENQQTTQIFLNHNLISELSSGYFIMFSLLEKLFLNHNKIKNIEKDAFDNCYNIKYLTLNHNKLEYLHFEVFNFMRDIEHLNLSSNRLGFVHAELFRNMISLRELDLSNNLIYQIENHSFSNLIRLSVLYLQGNENLTFNESSLFGLSSVKSIHLSFSVLSKRENLNYLIKSLRPKLTKTIGLRKYYESIFIQYYLENSSNQSDWRSLYQCKLTILFIKFNLSLNLKSEKLYSLFIENCFKLKLLADDFEFLF